MPRAYLLAIALLAVQAPARADDPPAHVATAKDKADAKAHIAAGTKLYNVQQYDKAADEYQQAYLLDPKPEYLYASAQAQRLGGMCDKAILSYQAYLRTKPNEDQRGKAEKNIERCQEDIKARETGSVVPPPEEMPPLPPAPPEEAPKPPPPVVVVAPPPPPEKSYILGHVIVGLGVAVGAGSTVLFLHGRSTINSINASTTYDTFASKQSGFDQAKQQQTLGVVGMALGGAIIGSGIVYYVLHSSSDDEPAVTPSVTSGGASVTIRGTF